MSIILDFISKGECDATCHLCYLAKRFKKGKETLTTSSNALNQTPYSFKMRFTQTVGTNPEALIATMLAALPWPLQRL